MSKLLRLALQDETEQDIKMIGPLADVYSQALQAVYNKEDPNPDHPAEKLDGMAMETQAIDAIMANNVIKKLIAGNSGYSRPVSGTTIYGVNASDVNDSDIVEVAKQSSMQPENFILVVDYCTNPEDETDDRVLAVNISDTDNLTAVLEHMTIKMGGRVYKHLGAALESLFVSKE